MAMEENQARISVTSGDGQTVFFTVLEQVKIAGFNYILVTDGDGSIEEEDAYILKELREEDGEGVYEIVDNDEELAAISKVFEETLGDIDLEI